MSVDAHAALRSLVDDGEVLAVDDSTDRYGYPFEWRDREFRPVPTSWLAHGQIPTTSRRTTWLAASAAYDPRIDAVVVRYAPIDGEVEQVRVKQFEPAGPVDGRYPKPLEADRWPAVLFNKFAPTIDTVRLGEREYVQEIVAATTGGEP